MRLNDLFSSLARAIERRPPPEVAAIRHAGQSLLQNRDPERLPEVIVKVAMDTLHGDDASLLLPGPDGALHLVHSHRLSPEIRAQVKIPLGERIAGRVASDREPALITDDASRDPRFARVTSFRPVRSSIVYPLVASDRLVGILNVSRVNDRRRFRRPDLDRTGLLASHLTLALENARLARQLLVTQRLARLGHFAGRLVHEISNPLTYLIDSQRTVRELTARLVELVPNPATLRQALDDAEDATRRITAVLRQFRNLSDELEDVRTLVDLNDVIQAALRVAGFKLRARTRVTVSLGENVGVHAAGDRLTQVFVNLLVNAAEAMGDRPFTRNDVIVSTERRDAEVIARVRDNGSGIRPEHLPRLFEPYFTTKGPSTGMGLGLPISDEIIRDHGGRIVVESRPDEGTTFTVVLPAQR